MDAQNLVFPSLYCYGFHLTARHLSKIPDGPFRIDCAVLQRLRYERRKRNPSVSITSLPVLAVDADSQPLQPLRCCSKSCSEKVRIVSMLSSWALKRLGGGIGLCCDDISVWFNIKYAKI